MQAVVKTPHIEINIKGDIPQKIITLLKEKFLPQTHLISYTQLPVLMNSSNAME